MQSLFLWLLRLFLGAVFVIALTLGGGYYLASRSLPDYDASFRSDALDGPVEIVRDTFNVPHIFGDSDTDVYFALGFAHAQDRLWQMTVMRRTAQGRLSEIFGARTLQADELLRRLDLYGAAATSLAVQDDYTKAALAAYAAGVNAWIGEINTGARGRGAPEFFLFAPEIAYWQPEDSLAILKLIAWQSASHLQREVLRARLSLVLSDSQVEQILPRAPGAGIAALPDYAALVPGIARSHAALDTPSDPLFPSPPRDLAGASNAWAAAPERAAGGGSLLANDPHLGFSAPSVWYLARLELATGGVIGGTVPGLPAVLVGRSPRVGWGRTHAYADDQDLFVEQLNPDAPNEYRTPDGYKAFETRKSIIRVRDGDPVTISLRWSDNGPILPGTHFNLKTVLPQGHVMALGWTGLGGDDTSMSAALQLMRAGSVDEAIEAGRGVIAPAQNLILADQDGIALQMVGRMPRRAARHESQGRMPAPGWRVVNRWAGWLNYRANPQVIAPESGILGNTNNKTVDRPFPLHVSFDWGDTQRIQRWLRLMQNREVHTRDSFIEGQLDTISYTARALLPLVGQELWYSGEAPPPGSREALRRQALDLLAEWNGEMNEHLPEPLIYAAWMRALQDRLIHDELGPLARSFTHVDPLFIEAVFRDVGGAGKWCDIVQTTDSETCADAARISLDQALIWINETYGGRLESLRWGDAHQARHDHPVLGDVPFLRWVVNIRQSTSGGDNTLMRGLSAGTGTDPFANVHGAAYRGVYDFADPDSSVFVTSTGQSGHPLSRHYDNLGERWRRGEYIPMSLDPDLARAAAVGVTVLRPSTPARE